MKVLQLRITHWRNLRDVTLVIPDEASLVCLVGENGTGKSAVLELLSACAHGLGIAQGVEISRGNPLDEVHDVELLVRVPVADTRDDVVAQQLVEASVEWDGRLRLTSRLDELGRVRQETVTAMDLPQPLDEQVARRTINVLRSRKETQHLHLDADRAYPPLPIEPHRYGEIWAQEWSNPAFTREWAFRPSRTLYEEWMKYFLGIEERGATEHITAIRRARDGGNQEPSFIDPFDGYRAALREVLPHLRFVGVESTGQRRTPLFDSAGLQLGFAQLSGGEREIAFLIGQIERFQLQRGLLLIDEPELHLNPDLLRSWLAFLRDTVKDGQIWIATHSLEAVEVAGPSSTFVFERDLDTRTVTAPTQLAGRPVLSALSAAVGSPAFAISRLRFVYVEGDRQSRERERFHTVCGDPDRNRFLEGGSCREVVRRLADLRILAEETGEQLHVGGVVDRDFRLPTEASELETGSGLHVLGCHEIENVFLEPEALGVVLERGGRPASEALLVLQRAADYHAGLWVAQRAAALMPDDEPIPKGALSALADRRYQQIGTDWEMLKAESVRGFGAGESGQWCCLLDASRAAYEEIRRHADLYRACLGKQSLSRVATTLGFSSAEPLERQVVRLWGDEEVPTPEDVVRLREYVATIS